MRVAAYCRVSTDSGDQIHSLESQTSFFVDYIRRNPDWELVGIYSDEGVTGTSVAGRVQFSRMIEDAGNGRIDLILTKEVSRFARNTVDALNYTRQLRSLGVGVIFLSDNISTLESDGELRLSLMSMLAQEESRRTSARVKWGMRRQMERGKVIAPPMLGYDCREGSLTVNSAEAEIVRRIFDCYVRQKMGSGQIARMLVCENTPVGKRLKRWSPTAVMRILTNEKYAGDLIQQKTTVEDYLTHKSVGNTENRIVFRDHHEAIVDRAVWEEAQRIRQSRRRENSVSVPSARTLRYWCSGKIECGICRSPCMTKTRKAQYGTVRVYRCCPDEKNVCTNRAHIDERILCACMQYVIRKLALSAEEAERQVAELRLPYGGKADSRKELAVLEKQVHEWDGKKKKLLALLLDEVIREEDYRAAVCDADGELQMLRERLERLRRDAVAEEKSVEDRAALSDQIRRYITQETVTRALYAEILEKIVLYGDGHIDIYLQGEQVPFSVAYRREGRGNRYTVFCRDYFPHTTAPERELWQNTEKFTPPPN